MVIARIESFIVGKGLNDALKRAEVYSKAGADAILIHSKEKTPRQIFSFAKKFKKSKNFIPLVSVPSTYSKVYEKDLIKNYKYLKNLVTLEASMNNNLIIIFDKRNNIWHIIFIIDYVLMRELFGADIKSLRT